jgi:hypothetical protein
MIVVKSLSLNKRLKEYIYLSSHLGLMHRIYHREGYVNHFLKKRIRDRVRQLKPTLGIEH